jgi:hypothetical protein
MLHNFRKKIFQLLFLSTSIFLLGCTLDTTEKSNVNEVSEQVSESSESLDDIKIWDHLYGRTLSIEWYSLVNSEHSIELYADLEDIKLDSGYIPGLENIEEQKITVWSFRTFIHEIETLQAAEQSCIECVYTTKEEINIEGAEKAEYLVEFFEVIKISQIRWEKDGRVYEVSMFDNEKDQRFDDFERIEIIVKSILEII